MNCHFCGAAATTQCRRCAKLYCDAHGDATLCDACLDPASAVPSAAIYRGSLLALLLGTAFAIWIVVRPPDSASRSAEPLIQSPPVTVTVTVIVTPEATDTPTPTVTATATPTASPTPTATPTKTPKPKPTKTPTATPTGTGTPTATPTKTPQATPTPQVYTVQPGDSLSSIAAAFGITTEELAAANGLAVTDVLFVGQQLTIPAAAPTPSPTPTP